MKMGFARRAGLASLILMAAALGGCDYRYQVEVIGRVRDSRGTLLYDEAGNFCFKLYDKKGLHQQDCEYAALQDLRLDGMRANLYEGVMGKDGDPLTSWEFTLDLGGRHYVGNVVSQVGLHHESDDLYVGKVYVDFVPSP